MKSLFDRTKVIAYYSTPETVIDPEQADGLAAHIAVDASGYLTVVFDTAEETDAAAPAADPAVCTGTCATCAANCASASEKVSADDANTAALSLDDLLTAHRDDGLLLYLFLDTPLSGEARKDLLLAAKRNGVTARMTVISAYHKTLDALRSEDDTKTLSISPLCDGNFVRPWIYAGYLGAPLLCMDARDILLGADRFGCETVDRAHNGNVMICAWNAEDEDTIRALVTVGCDALLTHVPALARTLVW